MSFVQVDFSVGSINNKKTRQPQKQQSDGRHCCGLREPISGCVELWELDRNRMHPHNHGLSRAYVWLLRQHVAPPYCIHVWNPNREHRRTAAVRERQSVHGGAKKCWKCLTFMSSPKLLASRGRYSHTSTVDTAIGLYLAPSVGLK